MECRGLEAFLVSQPENRRYLSGFDGSAGYLMVTAETAILATDFRYTEQAATQAPEYEVRRVTGATAAWLPGLIDGLKDGKLGFESGDATFAFHAHLAAAVGEARPNVTLVPVDALVEGLRAVKDSGEIDSIRRAAEISDRAFEEVTDSLQPGAVESEVAWRLEKAMREMGSQPVPFEIIVASGPNGAMAHHRPSGRKIAAGEPVVIDMGARVDGYCSDLTRTICLGEPDETFREIYGIVLRAHQAAIAGITAGNTGGITGEEADALARGVIEEAGHGKEFGHSLGHGVGLAPHEHPRVGPKSQDQLVSGMVFSIEPGIYISGWGGVRIEDLAVIENGRLLVLSQAKKLEAPEERI